MKHRQHSRKKQFRKPSAQRRHNIRRPVHAARSEEKITGPSPSSAEVIAEAIEANRADRRAAKFADLDDPACTSCMVANKKHRHAERHASDAFGRVEKGRQGVIDDDTEQLPDYGAEEVRPKRTPRTESL